MIKRFLDKTTKSVAHGAMLIAFSSLASRLLGLFRDGLFAGTFGTSQSAGIYFAAFKIPDFIFNFLIAGGLSVVFLPIFAEYIQKSKEEAFEMANAVLNSFVFLLCCFSFICFIFAPQILKVFLPGFNAEQLQLAIPLTRLLLLSPIFLGISSFLSSILMHFNNFISYSFAPIVYNICIILGIIFLAPQYGIFGVGIGVIAGAILHMLIQIGPALKQGLKLKIENGFKHVATKQVFLSAIPRTLSAASLQLDDLLTTGIVSAVVGVSSISVLAYSYNIQYIPVGLFALPFAVAVFPVLSKHWVQGNKAEFFSHFSKILSQIVFFLVPFSVWFFILRAQVVRLLLGTLGKAGVFGLESTKITAACLGIYALAVVATGIIPFFIRGFFASQNTKTPTIISVSCIGVDILLTWVFPTLLKTMPAFSNLMARLMDLEGFKDLAVIGVPMAWLVSATLQALLLIIFFVKQTGDFGIKKNLESFGKIFVASLLSGLACYGGLLIYDKFLSVLSISKTHLVVSLFIQTAVAGLCALAIYLFFCYIFQVEELELAKKSILSKNNGN
jgi:putative peptidoglycan lipid II flippase